MCGVSEVLLALNISPATLKSRSSVAADGGIERRFAAKKISLGKLCDPTSHHQVIESPLYRLAGT
jgi:hypothetical protein